MQSQTGARLLAKALERAGVTHVFGLPGTQNASLYSALAHTRIRTVLTGSELMAAFMANGYSRAGGDVPVVAVIPGPGFSYALTGFVEAAHDNAAFILLTGVPAVRPGRAYGLQALDQAGMVRGLARRVLRIESLADAQEIVDQAVQAAIASGPGPVLVEIASGLLQAPASVPRPAERPVATWPEVDAATEDEIVRRLRVARKVVVMAGQGTAGCPDALARFVERRPAMVLTTVSARGVLPETHPWSLAFDFLVCSVAETNRLLDEADLVLVLGCRTSHNGTGGYGLRLPEDRTAQVDLDPAVLGANYAPYWRVQTPVAAFLDRVLEGLGPQEIASTWTPADVAAWRRSLRAKSSPTPPEPIFPGTTRGDAAGFFAALQAALPAGAVVVTDTGHHQIMTRAHLQFESPRGLIVPADFQSMGFGLPAAIGAALADPGRKVVAILGDGGLMMSGLELATAVRERVDLTAIVFNDGQLGQIRVQQQTAGERAAAVSLAGIDLAALAAATGATYVRIDHDARGVLENACRASGVMLVDVPLRDSPALRRARWAGVLRGHARRVLGVRGRKFARRFKRRS